MIIKFTSFRTFLFALLPISLGQTTTDAGGEAGERTEGGLDIEMDPRGHEKVRCALFTQPIIFALPFRFFISAHRPF